MLRYFTFLTIILGVRCASAPFIQPCKPNDNACILQSAQAAIPAMAGGVPELGIRSLDPMYLDQINGDQAGLNMVFRDSTLTGLRGCIIEAVKEDLSKNKQGIAMRCNVTLTGDYKLTGRLILLPVEGEGKYTINIRDIIIKTTTDLSKKTDDEGKEHWKISDWQHSYQVKGGANFDFKNLFNGNKVLAQPVEDFLNNSWEDVMQEVAPPIVRAIVSGVFDGVAALYSAVPIDELVLQ